MPIATRLTNTGILLVNGIFDEQTDNLVYNSNLTLYLNASKTSSYSGTGATWSDLSGNGNNATLIGSPTYTTTQLGAIRFNASGTGQYANVPVAAIPSGGSQVSVCCWINLGNPATPPAASVFSCFDSVGNRIINIHLPWSDSIVYWDAGNSGGTYNRINTATLTLAQKTGWHHWAFTLNATAGTMAIYLDGVSIATGTGKTLTLGTVSTASSPCAIANFQGSANWNGSVSSFQIYNVALTAAQVAQNYSAASAPFTKFKTTLTTVYATEFDEVTINGGTVAKREINTGVLQVNNIFDEFTGAPVVDSSLKLWYDAGQTASYPGTGTIVYDLSGSGNNGTLGNGGRIGGTGTPQFVVSIPSFTGNGNSQIAYANASSINSSTTITLNWWGSFNGFNSGNEYNNLVNIREVFGSTGYRFGVTSAGRAVFWTTQSGGNIRLESNSTMITNNTYNLCVTYDGTVGRMYQNGNIVVSQVGTYNPIQSTTGWVGGNNQGLIGANINYSTFQWYHRALSSDEVTTNFNALRGRYGI